MPGRSRKKRTGPTPVEAVEHTDTRANIPTEELRDFVASDEKQPAKLLYPAGPFPRSPARVAGQG